MIWDIGLDFGCGLQTFFTQLARRTLFANASAATCNLNLVDMQIEHAKFLMQIEVADAILCKIFLRRKAGLMIDITKVRKANYLFDTGFYPDQKLFN